MFTVLLIATIVTSLTAGVLLLFFRQEIVWFEIAALLGISLLTGVLYRSVVTGNLTKDYEYWSTRFEHVEYHEPWDEYIQQTCTMTVSCGKNCTTIQTYDCSYIESHPSAYIKVDHLGNTYSTSKSEYLRLKNKNNNSVFKDMHRDYYSYDGDVYYTVWDKNLDHYECITTMHVYENKTQAVHDVFNFEDIDSATIATYQLHDYPLMDRQNWHYQKKLLGWNDPKAEHALQILNGELGNKKEVETFMLVFKNQPLSVGHLQESYWKGGNKNEAVIVINVDDNNKPTWCYVFSWSEKADFKIAIRDFVLDQDSLDILSVIDFSKSELQSKFVRKHFSDFDYLEVKLTAEQLLWSAFVSLIINILISIFIVNNEVRHEPSYRSKFYR